MAVTETAGAAAGEAPLLPGGGRLLGHVVEFRRDPLALLQRARGHGDVVQVRFGPIRMYFLNSLPPAGSCG